jgi:hypothetical protein
MQASQLFSKNYNTLIASNPNSNASKSICNLEALRLRDAAANFRSSHASSEIPLNALLLPCSLISSFDSEATIRNQVDKLRSSYRELGVEAWTDLHVDVHTFEFALRNRQLVKSLGLDTNNTSITVAAPVPQLIAFGTGDGVVLLKMIETFLPKRLLIIVSDWNEYASSFWHIDWPLIYEDYSNNGKHIELRCVKSVDEAIASIAGGGLLNIENSIVYKADVTSPCTLEIANTIMAGRRIGNIVSYLGYTVDEYNMLYNSALTLSKSPKVYSHPSKLINHSALVCGSGPSLDSELTTIQKLQETHVIYAAGSNFRTLLKSNIRVDFLVLVEREEQVYLDYEEIATKFSVSQTKLVMSSTCPSRLVDLFEQSAVFYRPALSPVSIWAESPNQVIDFEGPESVNAATSLALHLGAQKLVYFGVDLGTRTKEYDRSSDAQGASYREWSLTADASKGGSVYTNPLMKDVCMVIETMIAHVSRQNPRIIAYNCSDGMKIVGFEDISSECYSALPNYHIDVSLALMEINEWWSRLDHYDNAKLRAIWNMRKPRKAVHDFCQSFRDYANKLPSNVESLNLDGLDPLLSLDVSRSLQIPRRIMRSTLYKSVILILRQTYILRGASSHMYSKYLEEVPKILCELIDLLENECYNLFDHIQPRA